MPEQPEKDYISDRTYIVYNSAEPGHTCSTHGDLVEAGWTDVATLRRKVAEATEVARVDALSDLLAEIADDPIQWQQGGGAATGALVVTNIVKRRLSEGPREHAVAEEHDGGFWRCLCSPGKWRPVDLDGSHRARAGVTLPPGNRSGGGTDG